MPHRESAVFELAFCRSDEIGVKQACAQPGLVYATLTD